MITAEFIGIVVVHSLWQGAIIGLSFWLGSRFLGQNNPQARYRLAGLHLAWLMVWVAYTAITEYRPTPAGTSVQTMLQGIQLDPAYWLEAFRNQPQTASWVETFSPWAGYLWMIGVVFFSARMLGGLWYVGRLRSSAIPVSNQAFLDLHQRLSDKLNLRRKVVLGLSRHIGQPMAVGVLRPMVLFPAELMTGLPMTDLEMVLLHELAHIRRADYLINLIQHLLEITFFYHPAVWWISRDMRRSREASCDDLAVGIQGDAIGYAQTLTRLQRLFHSKKEIIPMTYLASPQTLKMRIERLFIAKSAPSPMLIAPAIAVMLLLILFHPWNNPALVQQIENSTRSLFAPVPHPVSVVPDLGSSASPAVEIPAPQQAPASSPLAAAALRESEEAPDADGHHLLITPDDSDEDLEDFQQRWAEYGIELIITHINRNDGAITSLALEVRTEHASASVRSDPFAGLMIVVSNDLKTISYRTGPANIPPPPPPAPGPAPDPQPSPAPRPEPEPQLIPIVDGDQVFIVIDGVIADNAALADLPPNEIESIEVLNKEASVAIYGEDAKNGVLIISTRKTTATAPVAIAGDGQLLSPLYELNGEIVDESVIETLSPEDISSVTVIKAPGDDEEARRSLLEAYGEAGLNGVIQIITHDADHEPTMVIVPDVEQIDGEISVRVRNNGDLTNPMFLINGERATKRQVNRLDPEDIESINVWKGESAIEKFGEEGADGVIEITTK